MVSITQTCTKCSKQFLVIDPEQQFLREKNLPLPTQCPNCRQERRLALRGERRLYRTKCQKCGKEIIVAYDPQKAESMILCREDYEKYTSENEYIINEPLPGSNATSVSPQPTTPTSPTETPLPSQQDETI